MGNFRRRFFFYNSYKKRRVGSQSDYLFLLVRDLQFQSLSESKQKNTIGVPLGTDLMVKKIMNKMSTGTKVVAIAHGPPLQYIHFIQSASSNHPVV